MSYFKKFTALCSGFAAFMTAIYMFRRFMMLDKSEEEQGLLERIKLFVSKEEAYGMYLMLVLLIMLCICVGAGVIFKKLPYLTPIFALPPLLLTLDMIKEGYIEDYPILQLLLTALGFIGCIYECVYMDRADGRHRAAWCADIICIGFSVFLIYLYRKSQALSLLEAEARAEVNKFDGEILAGASEMNMGILLVFAALYLLLTVVSFILKDVYFIDACLTVAPTAVLAYLWSAEMLTFHQELTVSFAVACLVSRLIPMLGGRARYNS